MKKYILFLFIVIFSVSCNSFLEEKMNPDMSNLYLRTEEGAEALMNGIYSNLKDTYGMEITVSSFCFGTDEYCCGSDGNYKSIGNYSNITPSTNIFWNLWNSWYQTINNINTLIDYLPDIPAENVFTDESKRDALMGEALFMRAFLYFHLVLNYGSVPMPLKGNTGEIVTNFEKVSVSQLYAQIISDLTKAVDLLPLANDTDFGRATKGAAQMLLSRAYLARVSVPDKRGNKSTDLDSVIYLTTRVIESGQYELQKDYYDVFDGDNDNNNEIIFSVQNTTNLTYNGNGNQLHMFFYSNYEAEPGMTRAVECGGRSYKRAMPTDYLMDLYDRKNDSRFYKSFQMGLMSNNAKTIPTDSEGNPKFSVGDTAFYYTMEYLDFDWDTVTLDNYNALLYAKKAEKSYNWHPRNEFSPAFEKEFQKKVNASFALDRRFFLTLKKHLDYNRPDLSNKQGSKNLILIRFAEAYMMRAEAYGRKENFDLAVADLNVIRRRAAYKEGEKKPVENWRFEGGVKGDESDTYPAIKLAVSDIQHGLNGLGDFVDFILDEMMLEFHGECRRWMDLVRFGRLTYRVKNCNIDAAPYIQDYHQLRPIPINHIERLIPQPPLEEVQNPGYY